MKETMMSCPQEAQLPVALADPKLRISGVRQRKKTTQMLSDCFLGLSITDVRLGVAPASPAENGFPLVENSNTGPTMGLSFIEQMRLGTW